jgi:hypothetical protein
MVSESARMTSSAEARFRVQAPNSQPRAVKVFALDPDGEHVVRRLAGDTWPNSTFLTAAAGPGPDALRDLSGERRSVQQEIDAADLVVMVASPGGGAHAASAIGAACSRRRVTTTTLIIDDGGASEEALCRTLAQVRPWSLMLVIASDDRYIDDMMTALRA